MGEGLYIFDFAGSDRPTGWLTPLVISPVSAVIAVSPTYEGGKPPSIHTDDGMVHASHDDHIYRLSGGWFDPNDGGTSACFKYSMATH